MKGSFFLGAGQKPAFELRELQLPELPDDGVLVRKDGRYVLPELEALNPENWA